MMSKILFYYN